jgi:predicted homoserine dehydrogenase-like protein
VIILDTALAQRAASGNPVRVGLVGAGYMGRAIAFQVERTIGLQLVGIANRTPERATRILHELGDSAPRFCDEPDGVDDAIRRGAHVVTSSPSALLRSEGVDVIIEATGQVEFGAHVVVDAIGTGKHVVMVNAELDATVGPILKAHADRAGVVLTNTDGDEPGVAMNLIRYVRTIGLEPVLAGNIKGFIDNHRTPDTQRAFAESVGQGATMITSFADGTKLAMEATLLANATGFGVAQRGMKGPECGHVRDVMQFFEPDELLGHGLVDYVLGAEPGSGAFVVGYGTEPIPQQYLQYFKLGDGPFYVFYIPWHLPNTDAPLSAARAVLFRDATVAPLGPPVCDVVAMAKRDLAKGDLLDGIGGFTCYGAIENAAVSRRNRLLPMGVAADCMVVRGVPADEPITYDDVRLPQNRLVDTLRSEQDRAFTS